MWIDKRQDDAIVSWSGFVYVDLAWQDEGLR